MRLFASPEGFSKAADEMSNFDTFMDDSLKVANEFIKETSKLIKEYFNFYKSTNQVETSSPWETATQSPFNLCIESKDYYRRDDFKLIDKLHKMEMKKKGLLSSIPFNVCLEN